MPMILLPETDDTTLCVGFDSFVTAENFTEVFKTNFIPRFEKNGFCNVYLRFAESFQGWTDDGAETSLKFIMANLSSARKLAHVNAPDSRRLLVSMLQPMSPVEVRYFELGEEQEALAWVKSL